MLSSQMFYLVTIGFYVIDGIRVFQKVQVQTFIVALEKKIQVYTFIVASGKKLMGVQFEILKNPGIDFYSGFRENAQGGAIGNPKKKQVQTFIVASEKKIQVYTFIVASGKKTHGVQFEILKNPGIDFYSGFRENAQGGAIGNPKKKQVQTFIVASEKNPGIYFYSGFMKKNSWGVQFEFLKNPGTCIDFIVASGKSLKGGGVQF